MLDSVGSSVNSFLDQDLSGDLWPSNRLPLTNDDLLLELDHRAISKAIRCLYQIGAHRFEEFETLLKLFPRLEKIALFEPNPGLAEELTQRFRSDQRVQVLPYAVSDRDGLAEFFIANNDGHSSSLLPLGKHLEVFPHVGYERSIQVEQITLPQAMARHQLPPPDMLFIDAQGAEYKVLSALTPELRKRTKIIYVEASLEEIYLGAGTLNDLKAVLKPEFKFAGYAPQNQGTPTHGNAIFVSEQDYPSIALVRENRAGSAMLPVSVLIPTRNVMASLPAHLKHVKEWSDLVEEFVVVDSRSDDGTIDFIQKNLSHPKLRIFTHPPGLYESWNYGIQQLRGEYVYISTVGDSLSRQGLIQLVETAQKLQSDVVLSRPLFVDGQGDTVHGIRWPVHEIIDDLAIREPMELPIEQAVYYAIKSGTKSILGSSASNLYRTEILKKYPFPVDFGHAGDTAWGILNAAHVRFAVSPGEFSSFILDSKYQRDSTGGFPTKVFWLICKTFTERMKSYADSLRAVAGAGVDGIQENKKICEAMVEAGERLLHEGRPFEKLNQELQQWAEHSDVLLAAERKVSRDFREWAEKTEGLLAEERRISRGYKEWAERTEALLVEERKLSREYKEWAERTEASLAEERRLSREHKEGRNEATRS